jgi:ubiquinone/menaquinone biosynthesis C-methylase UbiE
MYDRLNAEIWIKNYESGGDTFRTEHLEPYFKKIVSSLPSNSKIIDIGCGWGTIASFLKNSHKYTGVDINTAYFQ